MILIIAMNCIPDLRQLSPIKFFHSKLRTVFSLGFASFLLFIQPVQSQSRLYPELFPLSDVTLLDGPFKHARDLNIKVLLEYDVNRLLQPFRKEAGLPEKGARYDNWAGLDGHVGGHYLSAMAMNYAAVGNAEVPLLYLVVSTHAFDVC
jgi:hypothetical protein